MEKALVDICHHCGEEKTDCFYGFIAMTLPIPEAEAKIDKWGRTSWWDNLERTDLEKEEELELEGLARYDQLLNTISRGVQCIDCRNKEEELYSKYYPENK
jgi:hypothetical protein